MSASWPTVLAALAVVGTTGCAGTMQAERDVDRGLTMMCNSTVSGDTSACQARANAACGRPARLIGVISSVEMTGRPSGRLYTITARYICISIGVRRVQRSDRAVNPIGFVTLGISGSLIDLQVQAEPTREELSR